jgi:hypothetical protein
MKIRALALAAAGALSLGCVQTALAEIALNDAFSVGGFVSGSYFWEKPNPGRAADHFGLDHALVAFRGKSGPAGFVVSLYHEPSTPEETTVLDAALSYQTGSGLGVTAGRFQSILGYEGYFSVDNPNLAFASNELLTIAPGYHSGIKVEGGSDVWSGGAALLDSVYSGANYLRGDGELKDNQGFEAFVSFKGVKDLVVTLGAGHEGAGAATPQASLYDIWANYQLTASTLLAADWAQKDGGAGDRGHNWMALVRHDFSDRVSAAFRVSGEKLKGGAEFTRCTVTPSLRVSQSLTLRAEYTHTNYRGHPVGHDAAVAVQAFLKF